MSDAAPATRQRTASSVAGVFDAEPEEVGTLRGLGQRVHAKKHAAQPAAALQHYTLYNKAYNADLIHTMEYKLYNKGTSYCDS